MLFRKNIEPSCSYCKKGTRMNENEVICLKRGVVIAGGFCGSFAYDPLKRKPSAPVRLKKSVLSEEAFKL